MSEKEILPIDEDESQPLPELARKEASVWELATIIAGSRDFPTARTPEKAAVRILAGREMGVGPVASVIGIRVENGRVSMDATLMAGAIERSDRYRYKVETHTETGCVLVFSRKVDGAWEYAGKSAFSWEDATKAGLTTDPKKETWKKYPRNMLFARAMSNGARWYCAGIFGGAVYVHEEVGLPVDAEGRILESETAGNGSDLCTRQQRAEIRELLARLENSEADYCKGLAIKMLDELSTYEADKAIKGLAKLAAKKSVKEGSQGSRDEKLIQNVTPPPRIDTPAKELTPTQETLIEAVNESQQPSTPQQRQRIFDAAAKLEPEENARYEMLKRWLTKRGCQKYADLTHLQAEALIEAAEAAAAEREGGTKN